MEKTELDKFFEGVVGDAPKLEDKVEPTVEVKEEKEEANDDKKPNRAERRREQNDSIREQLREEREARIAAEAREAALKELQKPGDVDQRLLRLYGDNENGRLAAQLHQEMLRDMAKEAEEKAYARIAEDRTKQAAEERREEVFLDDQLSSLEDQFDADLTSNAPQARKARREFLELVERLSPKDENGNVTDYADFTSTYELYQESKKEAPKNTKSKELADRGMQRSVAADTSKEDNDKTRSWLRKQGLNV